MSEDQIQEPQTENPEEGQRFEPPMPPPEITEPEKTPEKTKVNVFVETIQKLAHISGRLCDIVESMNLEDISPDLASNLKTLSDNAIGIVTAIEENIEAAKKS